jgi:hypothetical protein
MWRELKDKNGKIILRVHMSTFPTIYIKEEAKVS